MPEDQDDIYGVSSTNKAMLYFTERISIKMQNKNNTKDIYYVTYRPIGFVFPTTRQ